MTTQTSPPTNTCAATSSAPSAGIQHGSGQATTDIHRADVAAVRPDRDYPGHETHTADAPVDLPSPSSTDAATTSGVASAGVQHGSDHLPVDTHLTHVAAVQSDRGRTTCDTHGGDAPADLSPPDATQAATTVRVPRRRAKTSSPAKSGPTTNAGALVGSKRGGDQRGSDTHGGRVAAVQLDRGLTTADTHAAPTSVDFSPPAKQASTTNVATAAGAQPGSDHKIHDPQVAHVAAVQLDRGHGRYVPQSAGAPVDSFPPDATGSAAPMLPPRPESTSPPAKVEATTTRGPSAGIQHGSGQADGDIQSMPAAAVQLDRGHASSAAHNASIPVDSSAPDSILLATPSAQPRLESTSPPTSRGAITMGPTSAGTQHGSDQRGGDTHSKNAAAVQLDRGQRTADAHTAPVSVDSSTPDVTGFAVTMLPPRPESTSPSTEVDATTTRGPSAGIQHGGDQGDNDTQAAYVVAVQLDRGHTRSETQSGVAPVDSSTPDATGSAATILSSRLESASPPTNTQPAATPIASVGSAPWDDPALLMAADLVDDLEGSRKAFANRRGALERAGLPDIAGYAPGMGALADDLARLEKQAIKELERAVRRHPLGPWVKRTPGIGAKQIGRLLSSVGDPYIRDEHVDGDTGELIEAARPRTLSELRSYCGVGDARVQVRRKGQKSNWNATAKMRLWNVAGSCVKAKATSPYGRVYDDARARYRDAVHEDVCPRCGPSGRPAQPGSPLSLAHQHARGIRAVMKAILADLWAEARTIHQQDQDFPVTATGNGTTELHVTEEN